MRKITAALLVLLLLTGCGKEMELSPAPSETASPVLSPVAEAPSPVSGPASIPVSWEEDPKGYLLNALEEHLEDGAWTVQFWLTENSGPTSLKMPEKEYGTALWELFSSLDWEVDEGQGYETTAAPDAYRVSFGQDIYCHSNDDVLCVYLPAEDDNRQLRFRAVGAELLCDAIADLWPGLEVNMGRVRVLPQETKRETGAAYVEQVLKKLKAAGRITDYELGEVWVQVPEWLGNSDGFDPELFVVHAVFSLKPAEPGLAYWQEAGIWHDVPDGEGWVHYEDWQNMLWLDPRDGLFCMT